MQQIGDKLTGMRLSQTGSEKQPMTGRSVQTLDQGRDRRAEVCLRNGDYDLPSQRVDPSADRAIAIAIQGPISAMTTLHLMSAEEREAALHFWIKSLRPYPPQWIEDAFEYFARNGGSSYPSPQKIISIINKRRGG